MAAIPALADAPIVRTLLRLAGLNILINLTWVAINPTVDAYVVGRLGAPALAGLSLVFPWVMLMQQMANGALGAGVASAVARRLGAGRPEDAAALVVHGAVLALGMAAVTMLILLPGGALLFRRMGAGDEVLAEALAYSDLLFAGAAAYWLLSALAAAVRGTGRLLVVTGTVVGAEVVHIALSPVLTLGWGPVAGFGIAGAAAATLISFGVAIVLLVIYLFSRRSPLRLTAQAGRLRRDLFWEILKVGGPAAINVTLSNLTVVVLTAFAASFGPLALSGYGLGVRLEYIQVPIVFGVGVIAMVGASVGAGRLARARRVAWVGAALAAGVTGMLGLGAALVPQAWLGLFRREPEILAAGTTYLHIVGPAYAFIGLGLALQFSFQGAGRAGWPVIAGLLRFLVAAGGGWVAVRWFGAGLPALFAAIAAGLAVFALCMTVAFRRVMRS
ncbi:MAG: MATE family efflux transporter [Candidatus Rokubacteria bacterium]|nr:MATE family efflux transporter [Candidatus Rokubacteria bacterium]